MDHNYFTRRNIEALNKLLTNPVMRRVPMVPCEPMEARAMRDVKDQSSGCKREKLVAGSCGASGSTGDSRVDGGYGAKQPIITQSSVSNNTSKMN